MKHRLRLGFYPREWSSYTSLCSRYRIFRCMTVIPNGKHFQEAVSLNLDTPEAEGCELNTEPPSFIGFLYTRTYRRVGCSTNFRP